MATPTTSSSPLDILKPVLNLIGRVPSKYQPALIVAVLEVVLVAVLVNTVSATNTERLVIILGLASIPMILATAQRYAIVLIGMVLLFCYLLIGHIYPQPGKGLVVLQDPADSAAQHPSPAGVIQAHNGESPAPGVTAAHPDSVRIVGSVHFADTREAIQGAFVDVSGYSERFDTTDARGGFDIVVPHWVIDMGRNRVLLTIQAAMSIDTVRLGLEQLPFWIPLARAGGRVAAAPRPNLAPRALMMMSFGAPDRLRATPATPPAEQEMVLTRVVLDSVATLHDGTVAATHWRFDLFVNTANAITIPWTSYSNRTGHNTVRLGGEITLSVPARQPAAIRIQGLRDAWIGVTQAYGAEMVALDSLPADHPVHRQLRVSVRANRNAGDFIFYYTLMRRGTPTIRANRA